MDIKLGYELETGKRVNIDKSHLIVTGVTQLSGKTTTLEALIKRSGMKAIVFKTKIGETGFSEGTVIPPYFKERFDWEYVLSLLEATMKEKLKFQRSWIIRACETATSLVEVKANIDETLAEKKMGSFDRSILIELQAFFNKVLPQLQYANFSKTLELRDGINIIDLEQYSNEIQGLVIRSVLDTVLKEFKNTIIVVPECWKFLPQTRGSPVKQSAEEFIRQGATNNNFMWVDSQDMTNVDKTPLKQISTWILGLQTEKNEVIRTLDQIPLPKKQKPKPDEIMTLQVGHFIKCSPRETKRVYVQPSWVDDQTAKKISLGKMNVDKLKKPSQLTPFSIQPKSTPRISQPDFESQKFYAKVQQDLIELRQDFFSKMQEQRQYIDSLAEQVMKLHTSKPEINIDGIVSLVLQKLPDSGQLNKQELMNEILAKVPKAAGTVTYEVAPLEKIKKDFLEEIRTRIIGDVDKVSADAKKVLKYIEAKAADVSPNELITKCMLWKVGRSPSTKMSNLLKELTVAEVTQKTAGGRYRAGLKERIKTLMESHSATAQEIEQVYNHILAELLNQ